MQVEHDSTNVTPLPRGRLACRSTISVKISSAAGSKQVARELVFDVADSNTAEGRLVRLQR